ncbi:MAG TPA: hypothetical protein VHA33_08365 [Candidatus Angelobacter sp.]|jgi:hypothetical protein|nr:hypothetical protein [Candidatus Angelobacter sp.]
MTPNSRRQWEQYWQEMIELKFAACYISLYRGYLSNWVTYLGVLKAVASSVGIAGWAIWRQYAFAWAVIIAAAQVADALKEVFPFIKRHKAASELTATYDNLFIDTQLEWENIISGRFTDDQITNRLHKLRKLQREAERRNFPEGLAKKPELAKQAKEHTEEYFLKTYRSAQSAVDSENL